MIMKNYVADELANKVFHLHKALIQAEKIIAILDEENKKLKSLLSTDDQNFDSDPSSRKVKFVA